MFSQGDSAVLHQIDSNTVTAAMGGTGSKYVIEGTVSPGIYKPMKLQKTTKYLDLKIFFYETYYIYYIFHIYIYSNVYLFTCFNLVFIILWFLSLNKGYESVKQMFESNFIRGADENSQLCVYVGEEKG